MRQAAETALARRGRARSRLWLRRGGGARRRRQREAALHRELAETREAADAPGERGRGVREPGWTRLTGSATRCSPRRRGGQRGRCGVPRASFPAPSAGTVAAPSRPPGGPRRRGAFRAGSTPSGGAWSALPVLAVADGRASRAVAGGVAAFRAIPGRAFRPFRTSPPPQAPESRRVCAMDRRGRADPAARARHTDRAPRAPGEARFSFLVTGTDQHSDLAATLAALRAQANPDWEALVAAPAGSTACVR